MASVLILTFITTAAIFSVELLHLPFTQGARPTSLCAELIVPNGYPCEEITVATKDGFLLGLQNIPYGQAGPNSVTGPPVLLMHGLSGAGDNYVVNNPVESLGFILADAGYDVYIGNNRNVQWSHGSSIYSPLQREYWDWTFDELAAFDIPALVDYIYRRRGDSKVFYVGHSQGTLVMFAGLTGGGPAAEQMKDKLRGAVFLAPVAYGEFVTAPFVRIVADIYADKILPLLGVGPVDFSLITRTVCGISPDICGSDLTPLLLGTNSYLNRSRDDIYFRYFPQATSSYNLNHYGQGTRTGEFKKYDRGPLENLKKYGTTKPPFYDLGKFPSASFPQLFFTGGIDQLADPKDVARLLRELPDAGNRRVLNFPDYGHADFIIGVRAYLDIYSSIISFFQNN